jgi:hypothetical protein
LCEILPDISVEFFDEYAARQDWVDRFSLAYEELWRAILGTQWLRLLRFKDPLPKELGPLEAYGIVGGFDTDLLRAQLRGHEQRAERERRVRPVIAFALIAPVLLPFFSSPNFVRYRDSYASRSASALVGSSILFLVVLYAISLLGLRLAQLISARIYADSLCVVGIVQIAAALKQANVLEHSDRRRRLLRAMHVVARDTRLLAVRYRSTDDHAQSWFRQHVRRMERYISERERWVQAPMANTQFDLSRDFSELAKVYITGQYGEFRWPPEVEIEVPSLSLTRRALTVASRLVGFAVPLTIVIGLLVERKQLDAWHVSPAAVGALAISWLMLGIDAAFKLGIVSGLASLLKEVRELV